MSAPASSGEHPKQEPSDLRPRAVLFVAVGVITMVLLVALLAHLLIEASGADRPVPATASAARSTYVTSAPDEDIAHFQQQKRARLEAYGWTDGRAYAHVPIELAMQKLAAQDAPNGGSR